MMKKILSVLALVAVTCVSAQDIHFSQIYNAPTLLNPAMAGAFSGKIRVIANWKDQWQGIGNDVPGLNTTNGTYRTFGFSFDHKVMNKRNGEKGFYLAYGVSAYADVAGDARLSTYNVLGTVATGFKINRFHELGLGIQGGWGYTSVDRNALRFPSDIDGSGGGSATPFVFDPQNWGDISAGLGWRFNNEKASKVRIMKAGVAVHHLNRPQYNFSQDGLLAMRMVAHWSGYFGFKDNKSGLWPSLSFQYQSPHSETMYGLLYRIVLSNSSAENKFALAFGVHQRLSILSFTDEGISSSGGNTFSDAIIPELVVEYANFMVTANYDVNISTLGEVSRGRGGFELSVRYIYRDKDASKASLDL